MAVVRLSGPTHLTVGRSDVVRADARTSTDQSIGGKTFSFRSSDTTAATIASDGTVRAVGPGSATISASADGVTGTLSVSTSDASLVAVTVTAPSGGVLLGSATKLQLAGLDSSNTPVAIRSATWTSSNTAVATISPAGLLTAVGIGSTTIKVEAVTVTAAFATLTVTVLPVPVASISMLPADTIVSLTTLPTIVAIPRDSLGNVLNRPVTLSSSSVNVATIDGNGNLVPHIIGPVTITATCDGKTAKQRYLVVPATGIYVVASGGNSFSVITVFPDAAGSEFTFNQGFVDGGGVALIPLPSLAGGSYRIRAMETGSSTLSPSNVARQLGIVKNVRSAPAPPIAVASIQMRPYGATITAPDTIALGSAITIAWSFDESLEPFPIITENSSNGPGLHLPHATIAPLGRVYWSLSGISNAITDAIASVDSQGITHFLATFTPTARGTVTYSVAAEGPQYTLMYPLLELGNSLRRIVVK